MTARIPHTGRNLPATAAGSSMLDVRSRNASSPFGGIIESGLLLEILLVVVVLISLIGN
jgi:hypothetical protein